MRYAHYIFLFFLFAVSCKHKEVQVTPYNKQKVKQHDTAKTKISSSNPVEQKMGMTSKQIKASKLYSFIDDWYGVPYKYGGCQKSGVDCSCFASVLCEKMYHQTLARSAGDIFKQCRQIGINDAREGDLCFFKIGGNQISHVGVYLKEKLFVHASVSKGVIINSLDEAYYKKYFFSAGRVKQ